MNRSAFYGAAVLAAVLGATVNPTGFSVLPVAHAQTLRQEVGKPLQAAQELMKARKYSEALAKVNEADAVPNKTPHESLTINRMRGAAAASAGDANTAANAFDAVLASGKLSSTEQLQIIEAVAGMFYRDRNYGKTMQWANRYFQAGGTSGNMRTVLIQAKYLSGDYNGAARDLLADIQASERAGRSPSENDLQLLASCYLKTNDMNGYANSLEKLVAHYPKKEYWLDLIDRTQRRTGFSDRYTIDLYRLRYATGNLTETSDFMEMAQLALQAGQPAEAKKVVDEGYAKGVLGAKGDVERQNRLRDLTNKQVTEDSKALPQNAKQAASAPDGAALVNVGLAYVYNGQFEEGLALMEQGIAKGNLRRPEEAKLRLGLAYLKAGQKSKALQTFRSVQGTDGAVDVARLWLLYARQNGSI